MRFLSHRTRAWVLVAAVCSSAAFAQPKPTPAPAPAPTPAAPAQAPQATKTPPSPPRPRDALKPYKEVITENAKSQDGVFKVHRIDEKVYWEIPTKLFGRDFLWEAEASELPTSAGFLGQKLVERVIRFQRRNNKLFILQPDYSIRSAESGGLTTGINATNGAPIVMAMPIETENEAKTTVVVDMTGVFIADQTEFPVRERLGAFGVDPGRSFLDRVSAFPNNIETRSVLTLLGVGARSLIPGLRPSGGQTVTATIHYSLNLLPEKPMMGRLADSRVGFFATDFELYGGPKKRQEDKALISRFRLEKKDPSKEISDPINPIVFYLAREVPERWRPSMKKAVEAWQPAFEQAGFSNAILCKDAPTKEQDPTWDPEDSRYNVIRWAPSSIENAMGPHVSDPRSGEIINAHVIIWHNILALVQDWYFSQAAAIDPRARSLPLPDDLIGDLLGYVVTHEVGHTLGLMHNFKASSAYTVSNLRDPKFTKENGMAASIMDYARFNYVAQPGDGAATIGKVGPYDKFAIEWGYKPIPAAKSADDEVPTLDVWAARQVQNKSLRFTGDIAAFLGWDPSAQTEDLSDDAVEATRLGLLNIRRVAKYLPTGSVRHGEDFDGLIGAYNSVASQRVRELLHVTTLVGGVVETDYHAGRGTSNYAAVPAAKQRQAVKFLMENLETPDELLSPEILNRVMPFGQLRLATSMNSIVLSRLLSESKFGRLLDQESMSGNAYTATELMHDITSNVWKELGAANPKVSMRRRILQRAYLDTMDDRLNGFAASKSDFRPLALGALRDLAKKIDAQIPKTSDHMTALHLQDARRQIERIILAKRDDRSNQALNFGLFFLNQEGPNGGKDYGCWQDPILEGFKAIEKRR